MARVGLEPTIPVFERAKTVHASDCAATGIGFRQDSLKDTGYQEDLEIDVRILGWISKK
jgi:hypothetical protein